MTKRANGEGSVRRLANGRHEASTMVTVDGERHRVSRSGATRREALQRLGEAVDRLQDGKPARDSHVTVAAWYDDWTAGPLRVNRAQATVDQYAGLVRVHVLEHGGIGRMPLAKVRPSAVEKLLQGLEGQLSASTRRSLYAALRAMFGSAVRDGLLARNPVEQVARPSVKSRPTDRALTDAQVRALLDAAEGHRLRPSLVVVAGTGLRRGELLGLKWADVDWKARELTVRRNLVRASDGLALREPKTAAGRRAVPLSEPVLAALRQHRTAQKAERLAAGVWEDSGHVFVSEVGGTLEPRNWSRWYATVAQRAVVADQGAHALRHYAATAMLASGATVRDVADVLGHSSPVVTLEVYASAVPEAQRRAVDAASSVLS